MHQFYGLVDGWLEGMSVTCVYASSCFVLHSSLKAQGPKHP